MQQRPMQKPFSHVIISQPGDAKTAKMIFSARKIMVAFMSSDMVEYWYQQGRLLAPAVPRFCLSLEVLWTFAGLRCFLIEPFCKFDCIISDSKHRRYGYQCVQLYHIPALLSLLLYNKLVNLSILKSKFL